MKEEAAVAMTFGQQIASYGLLTWFWVLGFSVLGGIASFSAKVRAGESRWVNIMELMGECLISAFVGVVTFLLTEGHVPPAFGAALVAISGHMGTRAVALLEQVLTNRLTGSIGNKP